MAYASKRNNATEAAIANGKTLPARFWSKVARRESDECWEWTGAKNPTGHGTIRSASRGAIVKAHQVSYYLEYGWVPPVVRHTCMNPGCQNPAHLSGDDDIRDNNRDADQTKITMAIAFKIRREYLEGSSSRQLAREYGISKTITLDILNYRYWIPDRYDGMERAVKVRLNEQRSR